MQLEVGEKAKQAAGMCPATRHDSEASMIVWNCREGPLASLALFHAHDELSSLNAGRRPPPRGDRMQGSILRLSGSGVAPPVME